MDYVFKKEDIEAFVKSELEALQARIAANIGSTGRTASGRTAKSMKVEVIPWGGRLTGRAAFGTLETGRKPGKTPANFTGIIRQWIKDKGLRTTPIPYKRKPSDKWQPKYTPAERGEQEQRPFRDAPAAAPRAFLVPHRHCGGDAAFWKSGTVSGKRAAERGAFYGGH